eukprot:8448025-Pyramimonas_sp.AAC.1
MMNRKGERGHPCDIPDNCRWAPTGPLLAPTAAPTMGTTTRHSDLNNNDAATSSNTNVAQCNIQKWQMDCSWYGFGYGLTWGL